VGDGDSNLRAALILCNAVDLQQSLFKDQFHALFQLLLIVLYTDMNIMVKNDSSSANYNSSKNPQTKVLRQLFRHCR
jgi:hypothetical protein